MYRYSYDHAREVLLQLNKKLNDEWLSASERQRLQTIETEMSRAVIIGIYVNKSQALWVQDIHESTK